MKTNLGTLVILCGLCLSQSCNNIDTNLEKPVNIRNKESSRLARRQLVSSMSTDPLVQKYNEMVDSIFKNILYNKHNFSRLNRKKLKSEVTSLRVSIGNKQARTTSEAKLLSSYTKIYKDAGMTNSSEYITLVKYMMYYKAKIHNKYPNLAQYTPQEKKEIFTEVHGVSNERLDLTKFAKGRPNTLVVPQSLIKIIEKSKK